MPSPFFMYFEDCLFADLRFLPYNEKELKSLFIEQEP